MIRNAGDHIAELSMMDLARDMQQGDLMRFIVDVLSWVCMAVQWGDVALGVLQAIRDSHEDGERVDESIARVRAELDGLESIRRVLLSSFILGVRDLDYERVMLWYMQARISLKRVINFLLIDKRFENFPVRIQLV